ncbi:hypothetical protein AVL56_02645 [Alteromonas stellipolaris]|nr:hypothetical protein AVL56_02645 [Alteromonas stellipolaris]
MLFFKLLCLFVYNKQIKSPAARAGTHTRSLLRIIAPMSAPLIWKLGVIYLQHKKVGLTVTLQHQGCFAKLSLQLAFSVV